MGVLAALLNTAIDALDEYGQKKENIREGYDFRCDPNTRSVDDITVKAGNSEFVLAAIWKDLPNYKPSLPNMAEAFKNIGWSVIDTDELEKLRKGNQWNYTKDGKKPVNTDCLYLLWFGDNDYETAILDEERFWGFDNGWYDLDEVVAWKEIEKPEEK